MKEKLVLVLVFAIMSGSAFAQVQKAQKKRVLLSGVGGAVKMKTPPALTAHSVKLVTGAVRRHLVSPVLMQTRGGKASGAVAEIDRAERGDRIVSAFKKRTTLPHSAYAPQSLNFGPLKVKQSARATITVICPSDGEVSVRYKDKLSQTRVTQLTVFGGDWSSDEPENATPVLVASSTSGRIVAKAGQELRIELEFVSSQTGRIDGTLDITGGDWQATVPTTAAVSLLGPLVGALVLPVERALTGITGTTIEVPMKVLSLSQSTVTARLIPQEVPAGVTVEPFSMAIGPGQTLSGNLRLRLSENAPETLEAPLRFSLETTGGAAKGQVLLSLNVYQPWKEFRFSAANNANTGTFARFEGVVQIKSDGSWNLEAMGSNYGAEKATLSFAFKGFGATGRLYTETVAAENEFIIRRSGTSLWLKEHYAEAALAGVIATTFELE